MYLDRWESSELSFGGDRIMFGHELFQGIATMSVLLAQLVVADSSASRGMLFRLPQAENSAFGYFLRVAKTRQLCSSSGRRQLR